MNLDDGKKLVKLARDSVSSYFSNKEIKDTMFKEKLGVFVSLHMPDGELRGCVGFPYAVFPLGEAIIKAAKEAAFNDDRFEPLREEELKDVLFEVSVLSKLELVKDIKEIKIGRDGLVVKSGPFLGLLLPQVFKNESREEALDMTCKKAGLLEETWMERNCEIYRFQAEIFSEKEDGSVLKR